MAEKLFADFQPIPTEQWEAEIHKDLKGADYQRRLVWNSIDGIAIQPYYRAENLQTIEHMGRAPGEFPFVRGTKEGGGWLVRQSYPIEESVKETNRTALEGLERGVDSISFRVGGERVLSTNEMEQLLEGIDLTKVEINFEQFGCSLIELLTSFIEVVKGRGVEPSSLKASFQFEPLTTLTTTGNYCCQEYKESLVKAFELAKEYPSIALVAANGYIFNDAGASIVQELAYTMAMGSDYLALLKEASLSLDEGAAKMRFKFGVGPNYFMEMAKFRAARILWATITKEYGVEEESGQKIVTDALTSRWNMTLYDPYVNMLRGTTQAMSASLAGVESLEILPFDHPFRKESDFSNRIARNSQIILKEEAHFDKVVDPAAGSYYVESLTEAIAKNSWELFKKIEELGGYRAALKAGTIQEEIATTANKRDHNIATRREILVGTNQYPNFTEKALENATEEYLKEEKMNENREVTPLNRYRGAEPFEALRLATENSGKTPTAFMLTFGNLAFCRARAQFSSNFFAVAGIEIIDNNRFNSIEEGVEAAIKSGAEIVVACSSDDEYREGAPKIAELLGDKAILVVAGEPACRAELEQAGIKNFISVKSNLLESLREYQTQLGVE